jgi:hypothetical protein
MKQHKIGIVLLALMLAAMAIIPLVSAAGTYSEEKVNLVKSNYIQSEIAYMNAMKTMQDFIASRSLDAKWNGATLKSEPQVIYDLDGAILTYRFTAEKDGEIIGIVDAASSKTAGGPVLSVGAPPMVIDEKQVLSELDDIVNKEYPGYTIGTKTIVCYNYPRTGMLVILSNPDNRDIKRIIIDVNDYSVIPEKKSAMEGDLSAGSYYDDMSVEQMKQNIQNWDNPSMNRMAPMYAPQKLLSVTRYEQASENWCAVTVAQMISQYYGYSRTQQAIANIMGNGGGGGSNPAMELTYYHASTGSGGLGKTNSIDDYSPFTTWTAAADEIDSYRPLKVGNLGHARTISGYKINSGSNYLYVNDPGVGWGSYWILYSSPFNNYVYVR